MSFEKWVVSNARVSSKAHKRISMDDKMSFFQQLSTLIVSGTPLLQALHIGAEQSQSTALQEALEEIAEQGRGRAAPSMPRRATYPHIFEHHWIEIIRTGEITGQMGPGACWNSTSRYVKPAKRAARSWEP